MVFFAMADDPLKGVVSSALHSLVSSKSVSAPISSLNLLGKFISHSSRKPTPLRLHELSRFESILESLSDDWDHGTISLLRESSGLTVMDVKLSRHSPDSSSRKRKRPVDEEAESDAESDNNGPTELEKKSPIPTVSSLSYLSKEMKEIYAILQKPTAKGRLLAEQVCTLLFNHRTS
jgi:mRNA (2'-O-methyladenosine-N6-)-methyltransferase